MAHAVHDHAGVTTLVDDCWNRIGTRGDQSCPQLPTYTRCLNCPVFEQGAAALLDRALSQDDLEAAARAHRDAAPLLVQSGMHTAHRFGELSDIADRYGLTSDWILSLNPQLDPVSLPIGRRINLRDPAAP